MIQNYSLLAAGILVLIQAQVCAMNSVCQKPPFKLVTFLKDASTQTNGDLSSQADIHDDLSSPHTTEPSQTSSSDDSSSEQEKPTPRKAALKRSPDSKASLATTTSSLSSDSSDFSSHERVTFTGSPERISKKIPAEELTPATQLARKLDSMGVVSPVKINSLAVDCSLFDSINQNDASENGLRSKITLLSELQLIFPLQIQHLDTALRFSAKPFTPHINDLLRYFLTINFEAIATEIISAEKREPLFAIYPAQACQRLREKFSPSITGLEAFGFCAQINKQASTFSNIIATAAKGRSNKLAIEYLTPGGFEMLLAEYYSALNYSLHPHPSKGALAQKSASIGKIINDCSSTYNYQGDKSVPTDYRWLCHNVMQASTEEHIQTIKLLENLDFISSQQSCWLSDAINECYKASLLLGEDKTAAMHHYVAGAFYLAYLKLKNSTPQREDMRHDLKNITRLCTQYGVTLGTQKTCTVDTAQAQHQVPVFKIYCELMNA